MAKALSAHQAFYPAAALYGALGLPASVLAMTGEAGVFAALAHPAAHAHEMLLGFALAVVAGNQLGTARGRPVVAMLLLWAAARAAFLLAPANLLAAVLNALFAGALAFFIAPRLFGTAKKLRNQALPATLAALCAAAAYWQVARYAGAEGTPRALVFATVMLFSMLMLFMGGRIVAPAVAGQLYRQGERLDARVQPRLEGALLIAGAIAAGTLLVPALQDNAAAAATAAAGALALVRLARWRLWAVRARPDLLCLASGYGWLGAGLVAFGASLAANRHENVAVHLITIGALGTLTFNVMATSWMLRTRCEPSRSAGIVRGTALIAAATGFRLLGVVQEGPWLTAAAGCWSAAFAVLLGLFWRASASARRGR